MAGLTGGTRLLGIEQYSLSLQDVTRCFGDTTAVSRVFLEVPPGQFVGIIRRSVHGARDVTGLKGRVLREWRRDCAMIFLQINLVDRLDLLTSVLVGRLADRGFFASMAMQVSDAVRAGALTALQRLDLLPQALQKAGTLSGGQQQRVAATHALVQRLRVMLADEPIASLGPGNTTRVMEALRTINAADGLTVLVNLHTIDTVRTYCQRIIALRCDNGYKSADDLKFNVLAFADPDRTSGYNVPQYYLVQQSPSPQSSGVLVGRRDAGRADLADRFGRKAI